MRYAVIGLGHIAQAAVLPAFAHAKANSRLCALVSGDPEKLDTLGRLYKVQRTCTYDEQLDELFGSGEIDAVYIALPNAMHRDFAVRAAKAGLHVLCEKPMAVTVRDCERMIAAAREHRVKLMIAYRLHFERANLEAVRIAGSGQLGELKFLTSQFAIKVAHADNIRLQRGLGGGPLHDIGIYCVNAARAIFRAEPHTVWASAVHGAEKRFREVPEAVSATLHFDGQRIASFVCSFGAGAVSFYQVAGTRGSLRVEPAYEYATGLGYEVRAGGRVHRRKFGKSDQFAPELVYFSDCVLRGKDPEPSGAEGLADVRVIEGLQRSVSTGKPVRLQPRRIAPQRPDLSQELRRPPVREPSLINVAAP